MIATEPAEQPGDLRARLLEEEARAWARGLITDNGDVFATEKGPQKLFAEFMRKAFASLPDGIFTRSADTANRTDGHHGLSVRVDPLIYLYITAATEYFVRTHIGVDLSATEQRPVPSP
jgi:hypothetical protein